jgi:lipoprotein-releasing system permease protein
VQSYILRTGVIKIPEATHGVVLKGVGEGYDLSFFAACLTEGELPRTAGGARHKDILISVGVARMMRLGVDDRVDMIFVEGGRPRRDRFRVSGLYSSGFGEMDDRFALTDMAGVRRLAGWSENEASGYEVRLAGMDNLSDDCRRIGEAVERHGAGRSAMMALSVEDEFPQYFDWLATHDVNAAVIIVIMIVVALISMTSALLVVVLERIRMIGVLKTLGMTNGALRRVFVLRAAGIVAVGLALGNALGIGAALVQRATGLVGLDEAGYSISRVPIELGAWWIAALDVGVFAVIVGVMLVPTTIVGRITPEKTVRYQ